MRRCSRWRSILDYLWLVTQHKWFVLVAGIELGVPWSQIILHDWSKFFLAPAYARIFTSPKSVRDDNDYARFERAWLYHQNHEPHHWEYWIPRTTHALVGGNVLPIQMPERYVREMVADWLAASRAYNGEWPKSLDSWEWFQRNAKFVNVHPETGTLIGQLLDEWFKRGR